MVAGGTGTGGVVVVVTTGASDGGVVSTGTIDVDTPGANVVVAAGSCGAIVATGPRSTPQLVRTQFFTATADRSVA